MSIRIVTVRSTNSPSLHVCELIVRIQPLASAQTSEYVRLQGPPNMLRFQSCHPCFHSFSCLPRAERRTENCEKSFLLCVPVARSLAAPDEELEDGQLA